MFLTFPDWRDIGKKLRDILNPFPGDHGPSPKERLKQRLQDVMKGFAYFDTIDEVLAWSKDLVDPLQRANTPLLRRLSKPAQQSGPKSKVLLCHDYRGGYHDYESVRSGPLKDELYSCEHLQYADLFVYFSHKLCCVPPPSWTNTLHRNGVKVLGTFLVEPQTLNVDRILTLKDGKYVVAEILANMARTYGFDGWLLNIEKKFASNSVKELVTFIESLKEALGGGSRVVWYDALTINNEVRYQNGLTEQNLPFAKVADKLFTNYKWTESKLKDANGIALAHGLNTSKISFGIDVFAQNVGMPGRPRITFPLEGGGGTNTGLAIKVLNEHGFSSAVFGAAWAYEHFRTSSESLNQQSLAKSVDESLWDGSSLPHNIRCDCKSGQPHNTAYYEANPITSNAYEFPAGSSTFFETNFSGAFDERNDDKGQKIYRSALGSQSVLPHLLPLPLLERDARNQPTQRILYGLYERKSHGARHVLTMYTKIIGETGPQDETTASQDNLVSNSRIVWRLRLYKVAMPIVNALSLSICYSRTKESESIEVGVYATFHTSMVSDVQYQYYALPYSTSKMVTVRRTISFANEDSTLVEVGFYCKGNIEESAPLQILRAFRLAIMPVAVLHARSTKIRTNKFTIDSIQLVDRGAAPNEQKRLTWKWHGKKNRWPKSIPWSKTTGPFSHFTVCADGRQLGRSYCLEFPLTDEELNGMIQDNGTNKISFKVRGWGFGGLCFPTASESCAYEKKIS
ncbi:hypothetical protein MMC17_000280 [Xylographa soralifera]|nr:hypothetical protein [Xylographa soralifera]